MNSALVLQTAVTAIISTLTTPILRKARINLEEMERIGIKLS
jgi:hypothetical protein